MRVWPRGRLHLGRPWGFLFMTAEEILEDMGIQFLRTGHHHCRPGWIQLDCPFCGLDTQRFHLGWNLASNYTHCWKCGGHFPDQVLVELGMAKNRARALLKGLDVPEPTESPVSRNVVRIPTGLEPLPRAHRDYLRGRGFNPKTIARIWQVQGIRIHARLPWRIYIPIHYRGEVVSWTTRSINPEAGQRYISASAEEEKMNHKSLVYGQDHCHHSIVVVEGPMDAWNIGPGACALFGTAFTAAQVRKLVAHPYRYIVFDSTTEAQARAGELASQLSAFPGLTEVIILDADDPGSASATEIKLLRRATKL
jgi:hypothetical protein